MSPNSAIKLSEDVAELRRKIQAAERELSLNKRLQNVQRVVDRTAAEKTRAANQGRVWRDCSVCMQPYRGRVCDGGCTK